MSKKSERFKLEDADPNRVAQNLVDEINSIGVSILREGSSSPQVKVPGGFVNIMKSGGGVVVDASKAPDNVLNTVATFVNRRKGGTIGLDRGTARRDVREDDIISEDRKSSNDVYAYIHDDDNIRIEIAETGEEIVADYGVLLSASPGGGNKMTISHEIVGGVGPNITPDDKVEILRALVKEYADIETLDERTKKRLIDDIEKELL